MTWLAEASDVLAGGPELVCGAGHDAHPTYPVGVALGGPQFRIPDYPPVPLALATRWWMRVFDWRTLHSTEGVFCPGADIVSEAIECLGIWEGYGTLLALDVCSRRGPSCHVIDLGSQLGWFSLLAASFACGVLAVDANPDARDALEWAFDSNWQAQMFRGDDHQWLAAVRGTLTEATPAVPLPPAINGHGEHRCPLWKCDVEGAEHHAVRAFSEWFTTQRIEHALVEVSPTFTERGITDCDYPALCEWIVDCGYQAFMIPGGKSTQDPDGFGVAPLAAIQKYEIPRTDLRYVVADCEQADLLFTAGPR